MKIDIMGADENVNSFFNEIIKLARVHKVAIVTAVQDRKYQPPMQCPLISKRFLGNMTSTFKEAEDPALGRVVVAKNSFGHRNG